MKNKIKKIIATTFVSAISLTTLGVAAKTQNYDNNNEKMMQNYLISKDIEKTSAFIPNKNIGKIVETSTNNQIKYTSSGKQFQFLNNEINESEIENNIALPQSLNGLSLFVLSTSPYISFSNDNDELKIKVNFKETKTNETQQTSLSLEDKEKLNTYNLKRSILLIYANEIYNNNITLSSENKTEINIHIETISNSTENETTNIDNKISALNSIIDIIESNLTPNSIYYQKSITNNINNLTNNNQSIDKITESSSNQDIANKIACVLNGKCSSSETENNLSETNQTKQRSLDYNQNNSQTNLINSTTQQRTNEIQNNESNSNLNDKNIYRKNNLRNRRRNNKYNQNLNINSNANNIMEERINNQNNINNDLRNNTIMEDSKTMRADRTTENISQDKYTNTNNNTNEFNRASRVPYQSTNNFQR